MYRLIASGVGISLALATGMVFILAVSSVSLGAEVSKEKFESEGKSRVYYLYVPDSAKSAGPVPLLILLHGSNRNGLALLERWKDLADKEGFIVVGPDSSDKTGWRIPEDAPEFIYELSESLIAKYPIAADRLYLFGHSAGAVMALNLAMYESEYFAAVTLHAGAWRSEDELKVIDAAKRKMPLKIIVGDRDAFFPVNDVKRTETALLDRGFPISVSIIKNHTHAYYDRSPEVNADAWEFLKKHSLQQKRRHARLSFGSRAKLAGAATSPINDLRTRANDLFQKFYGQEEELRKKDFENDKSAVRDIARTQIQLLVEASKLLREAADLSERAQKKGGDLENYFSLLAQASKIRVESFELLRTRAELLLSDEDLSSVFGKRNELGQKSHALHQSAEELEKRATQLLLK